LREKIGVMFGESRNYHRRPRACLHSSVRIDIRRIGAIKDGEDVVATAPASRS
jgi:RecA/RadA recombinase